MEIITNPLFLSVGLILITGGGIRYRNKIASIFRPKPPHNKELPSKEDISKKKNCASSIYGATVIFCKKAAIRLKKTRRRKLLKNSP